MSYIKKHNIKKLTLICFSLLSSCILAQSNNGITLSNYSGVNALDVNPAKISTDKAKLSIGLFKSSTDFNNNILTFGSFFDKNNQFTIPTNLTDSAFVKGISREEGKTYNVSLGTSVATPIANFMFKLGRFSFGLTSKTRVLGSMEGLNLNTLIYNPNKVFNDFIANGVNIYVDNSTVNVLSELNTKIDFQKLAFKTNVISQVGLTGAMKLNVVGRHDLHVGITLNYIKGIYAAGLVSNDASLDFNFKYPSVSLKGNGSIEAFYSNPNDALNYSKNFGLGADLGAVFVYKGKDSIPKFNIGVSVMDLGYVNYTTKVKGVDFSNTVISLHKDSLSKITSIIKDIDKLQQYSGIKSIDRIDVVTYVLPSVINIYGDVNLLSFIFPFKKVKKLYLGFAAMANINLSEFMSRYSTPQKTNFVFCPKIETKYLEFSLPLKYITSNNQYKIGGCFRVFGFFVGSDNALGLMRFISSSFDSDGFNIYTGYRISF